MSSLILEFIAMIFVAIGLILLFGLFEWLGLVFNIIGFFQGFKAHKNIAHKLLAIIGSTLNIILIVVAVIRLVFDAGII